MQAAKLELGFPTTRLLGGGRLGAQRSLQVERRLAAGVGRLIMVFEDSAGVAREEFGQIRLPGLFRAR